MLGGSDEADIGIRAVLMKISGDSCTYIYT